MKMLNAGHGEEHQITLVFFSVTGPCVKALPLLNWNGKAALPDKVVPGAGGQWCNGTQVGFGASRLSLCSAWGGRYLANSEPSKVPG